MDRILYYASSAEERIEIIRELLTQDFLWHGEKGWTPEKIEKKYSWEQFPTIVVDVGNRTLSGYSKDMANTPKEIFYPMFGLRNYIKFFIEYK